MSGKKYRYRVVDVFTTNRFEGNPLSVFPDASGIADEAMPRIARELNHSETVFVFPPENASSTARLRIFTPSQEMAFAGHPTIGTSFILHDEGAARDDRIVLEENIGPVPVRIESGDRPMFWLTTPPIREGEHFDRAACARALGLSIEDVLAARPQRLDAGNPTLLVALRDRAAVDRAWIDMRDLDTLRGTAAPFCVFVFTPTRTGAYSRMFAPEYGMVEDPATGSSTGPLALYMMRNGLAPSSSGSTFVSEQGTKMGRRSLLHIKIHGDMGADAIEVGGYVTPVAEATMFV